jgi:ring-1,2-phenylacetyl-CoA epoxidase subunit PaaE
MWFSARPQRLTVPRPHGASSRWVRGGVPATAPRPVRVVDVVRETADAVTVTLATEDGRPLPFRAGQYLTHCYPIGGRTVRRAFSLCAPEGGPLAYTVKILPGGLASTYVAHALKPGDGYQVLGPSGEFTLEDGAAPLVFLAAGSGITPVIGLIETALMRDPDRAVRLVYASRDETSIIFRARLEALAARHPALHVEHVLSQPSPAWPGARGRLDAQRAATLLAPPDGAVVYLCGPQGLMDAASEGLTARGWPAQRIHRERFLAAPAPTAARPTQPQEIVFARSGRTVTQRPGESVLEAGLREGVALAFSCTVGGCAACKVKISEGQVALNEPNCLAPDERAQGYTLACSAYALSRLVVNA